MREITLDLFSYSFYIELFAQLISADVLLSVGQCRPSEFQLLYVIDFPRL